MAETTLPVNLAPKAIDAIYTHGVLRPVERLELAEDQRVSLHILPPRVRIPAIVARRKVNVFVGENISCSMGGGTPELVLGARVVWRVPVFLTFPSYGVVGTAGTIDVDAETGDLLTTPSLVEELIHNAETLAARLPSEAGSQG